MTDCESPGMFLLAFEPDRVSTTQEHSKDAEDSCLASCGAGCDRRTRWCPRHRCLALPVPFDRLLRAFFGKIVAGSGGRRNVDYRRCTEIVSKSPQIFLSQRQGARTRRNVFWFLEIANFLFCGRFFVKIYFLLVRNDSFLSPVNYLSTNQCLLQLES